jgi:hypothetical protein
MSSLIAISNISLSLSSVDIPYDLSVVFFDCSAIQCSFKTLYNIHLSQYTHNFILSDTNNYIFDVSQNSSPIIIYNLSGNTYYTGYIKSTYNNNSINSITSISATTNVAPPYNLTPIYDSSSITVSFTLPKNTYTTTYYTLRATDTTGEYVDVSGITTPLQIYNLSGNTLYTCAIKTTLNDNTNLIATSPDISVTTAVAPPTDLIASFYDSSSIQMAFTLPNTNTYTTAYYTLRATDTTGVYVDVSGTTNPLQLYNLSGNTLYTCTIKTTLNDNTNVIATSSGISLTTEIAPPTNLIATFYDSFSIRVAFTLPKNTYTTAYYTLRATDNSGNYFDVSGTTSPLQLYNLSENTLYTCSVTITLNDNTNLVATSPETLTQQTSIYTEPTTTTLIPVIQYNFDTSSFDISDSMGIIKNVATDTYDNITGSITPYTTLYSKYGDSSLMLSNNSCITVTSNTITPTSSGLSFSFWYYIPATFSIPLKSSFIFDFGNGVNIYNIYFALTVNTSSKFVPSFWIYNNTTCNTYTVSSPFTLSKGVWHHFVISLSPKWLNFYMNGTLISSLALIYYPLNITLTNNYVSNVLCSMGFIDDFIVYNKYLSSYDVTTLYTSSVSNPTILIPDATILDDPVITSTYIGSTTVTFDVSCSNQNITYYKLWSPLGGTVDTTTSRTITVSGLTGNTTYTFYVNVTNDVSNTSQTSSITIKTVLNPPVIAYASNSLSSIDMTFTSAKPTGFSLYTLYWSPPSTTGLSSSTTTGTTISVSNLSGGTIYSFNGTVKTTTAISANSVAITAGTTPIAPTVSINSVFNTVQYTDPLDTSANIKIIYNFSGVLDASYRLLDLSYNLKGGKTGSSSLPYVIASNCGLNTSYNYYGTITSKYGTGTQSGTKAIIPSTYISTLNQLNRTTNSITIQFTYGVSGSIYNFVWSPADNSGNTSITQDTDTFTISNLNSSTYYTVYGSMTTPYGITGYYTLNTGTIFESTQTAKISNLPYGFSMSSYNCVYGPIYCSADGSKAISLDAARNVSLTDDFGTTWTKPTMVHTSSAFVRQMYNISPDGNNIVYLTDKNLSYSTNTGATWKSRPDVYTYTVSPRYFNSVYITDDGQILFSSGINFISLQTQNVYYLNNYDASFTTIKTSSSSTSNGYLCHATPTFSAIVTQEINNNGIIQISYNYGSTWNSVNDTIQSNNTALSTIKNSLLISGDGNTIFACIGTANYYIIQNNGSSWVTNTYNDGLIYLYNAISYDGSKLIMSSGSNFVKYSTDYGATLNFITDVSDIGVYAIKPCIASGNSNIAYITDCNLVDYGVSYITTNFFQSLIQLPKVSLNFISGNTPYAISDDFNYIYCIYNSFPICSIDRGQNFFKLPNNITSANCMACSYTGQIVYIYQNFGVYKSTNYGQTFFKCSAFVGISSPSIMCSSDGSIIITQKSTGLVYSRDGGNTVSSISNTSGNYYVTVSRDGSTIYVGSNDATTIQPILCYTWDGTTYSLYSTSSITDIWVALGCSQTGQIAYVGSYTNGNIYNTTDYGNTWNLLVTFSQITINATTTNQPIIQYISCSYNGSIVFPGINNYRNVISYDYGNTWTVLSDILPNTSTINTQFTYVNNDGCYIIQQGLLDNFGWPVCYS